MAFFSQSFIYNDPWSIVALAFFLRYPNPHAQHVVSSDVLSRTRTHTGSLLTTRLLLKTGSLPKWAPKGIISRAETWVLEESEVSPCGKVVRCVMKNLDHQKVVQVEESVVLRELEDGRTMQTTDARFVSHFGWGLTKRIENHSLKRFKANIQKSREGLFAVLRHLRESRFGFETMALGSSHPYAPISFEFPQYRAPPSSDSGIYPGEHETNDDMNDDSRWNSMKSWLRRP